MSIRLSLLLLSAAGTIAIQGCAGQNTFYTMAHEGEEGGFGSFEEADSNEDLGDFVHPVIESFMAEPLYLPLGGGDVELRWSARQATRCTLRIDDQIHVVGDVGEAIVAVEEDSELELLCIDDEDDFDSMLHEVTVLQPPADNYDDGAPVLVSPNFVKTTTQDKFGAGTLAERRLSLEQPSRITLTPAALPARSSVTLWLAEDSNGDGWVDDDEILAISRSNSSGHIQLELEARKYTLFIESDGLATEWTLESYILPMGE